MVRLAVLGSGPGAMYTVKFLLKHHLPSSTRIDIFERLSHPFGLVRYGVAPDHKEVKEVANEFNQLLRDHSSSVRLLLNHNIQGLGDVSRLRRSYSGVLIATGAQEAHRIPFKSHPVNTFSAQDFVLWYNGHPDKQSVSLPSDARNVSIVGHGNVALDVARMLSKSAEELEPLLESGLLFRPAYDWFSNRQSLPGQKTVSVLGRSGYLQAAFTNKEFRELTQMKDAVCRIDESELEYPVAQLKEKAKGDRAKSRGIPIVESCINNFNHSTHLPSNLINLRFFTKPVEYVGNPVRALSVQNKGGSIEDVLTDIGIESIGFKVSDQFGLPIDPASGGVMHDGQGRVALEGVSNVYVAGWAKRGPKGVIAANIPCCLDTAATIASDIENGLLSSHDLVSDDFPEGDLYIP